MLPAAARRFTVRIERRGVGAVDQLGNRLDDWSSPILVAIRSAAFRPQFAREAIEAGRLADGLGGVVTILADGAARTVDAGHRLIVLTAPYADRILDIVAVLPTPDGREIELTVTEARP